MWILGHVAVGYLAWSAWIRYRKGRPPTGLEFWVALFGSLFPDIVDKPLAWTFGALPAGRSLAHSLLTAAIVIAVVRRVARNGGYETAAAAFGLAYVAHCFADAVAPLLAGQYAYTYYLLWPLLPLPYYDTSRSLVAEMVRGVPLRGLRAHHLLLTAVMLFVWIRDNAPGLPGKRRLSF